MSDIIQPPINDPLTGQPHTNQNHYIYDVPNNIAIQKFIPRQREHEKYKVGHIEFCLSCIQNDNKYCPVFTYTTNLKLTNGTNKQTVLTSYYCTIHDTEQSFPNDYSKQMFENTNTQLRYEYLTETRYFQSNSSSELYKMIFENPKIIKLDKKEYCSRISSLQELYEKIFDIDQELFLLFEKKRFVEKNLLNTREISEPKISVKMKQNSIYNFTNNSETNRISFEDNTKNIQSIFKNLKTKNHNGFKYMGSLSTERIVYYKDDTLKTDNILRVPNVFEHVTLGGILGKNDLLEFGKYLKDEVFTKRQRNVEYVQVNENKIEMDSHSIKAMKNINIIKYTMEDYPFMVSSIINWISCEDNYSKLMYPH